MFPFNHILDETEFLPALPANDLDYVNLNSMSKLLFVPFEFDEDPSYIPGFEYDPDIHFFNQISQNINFNSNYYLEDGFKSCVSEMSTNNYIYFLLFYMNTRSTRNNLNKMLAYLETLSHKFDIIGLSETWLKESEADLYDIPGYNHVTMPRVYAERSGVSLYVKNIFSYEVRKDLSFRNEYCECLFIEIADVRPVLIAIVYRRPGTDLETFTEFISDKLDIVKSDKQACYLLGDLNINLLGHNVHRQTTHFLDIMYSNGFIPLINRPTRVTSETATIIDHIYSNDLNVTRMTVQGILVTDITDHYPIFHFSQPFGYSQPNKDDTVFYTRRMNISNIKLFKFLASQSNWTELLNKPKCNDAFDAFYTIIKSCYYQAFPLINLKKKYAKQAPWITSGLRASIIYKNKLYRKSLKHPTAFNQSEYSKYRNYLTKLLRCQERNYYENLINQNKHNLSKTWSVISTVINNKKSITKCSKFTHNNRYITHDNEIANHFNKYFVNIGPNLVKNIPNSSSTFKEFPNHPCDNSIFLQPVTENETLQIMKALKNGSPGIDDICAKPIKYISDINVIPLSYICQLSLTQGCFPNELKVAKSIPLYKNGEKSQFNNYMPISLLPLFSKIVERLMYNRLYAFLIKYELLYSLQFGFRNYHATYMALVCMLDKLHDALEKGDYAIGIFYWFSKGIRYRWS